MKEKFTMFEKIWVTIFTVLILGATCYFSYTGTDYTSTKSVLINWVISPVSALTGIASVILTAKGKLSSFWFGIINTITYGYISIKSGVYGDAFLNLLYFLPMQFIGIHVWKNNLKNNTLKSNFLKHPILILLMSIIAWIGFSEFLENANNFFTTSMKKTSIFYSSFSKEKYGIYLDASTEIGQFIGQILLTLGRVESWIFWFLINVVSIYMWTMVAIANPANLAFAVPTLIMYVGYLVNSVYGYITWSKRAKVNLSQV